MTDVPFLPEWTSPPGETIAELLSERSMSVDDLARHLDCEKGEAEGILRGELFLTQIWAERLAVTFGASSEFWAALDKQYREDSKRILSAQDEEACKAWLRNLPVGDMTSMGWVSARNQEQRLLACLRFFGVSSPGDWHERYGKVLEVSSFRTSKTFPSHPPAVAAWIRQGEVLAAQIACERWNAQLLASLLEDIRGLTRTKDPEKFMPRLQAIGARCGVAVIALKSPAKCRASGVVKVLPRGRRLVLLSFRYLTDDQFWFTVFHEIGHLLLHSDTELVIEGDESASPQQEEEANRFAVDVLVPPAERAEMLRLPVRHAEILRFAKRIGIAPGIVVGQLQKVGRVPPTHLNRLKRRYAWSKGGSAVFIRERA